MLLLVYQADAWLKQNMSQALMQFSRAKSKELTNQQDKFVYITEHNVTQKLNGNQQQMNDRVCKIQR